MARYALQRALLFIPTLLGMTLVTFIIMQLTPGSPFSSAANGITPEMIAALEKKYGLDKPMIERFGLYVWHSLQGDFGVSYQYRPQEVSEIIGRSFPVSLQLGTMATLLAVTV